MYPAAVDSVHPDACTSGGVGGIASRSLPDVAWCVWLKPGEGEGAVSIVSHLLAAL